MTARGVVCPHTSAVSPKIPARCSLCFLAGIGTGRPRFAARLRHIATTKWSTAAQWRAAQPLRVPAEHGSGQRWLGLRTVAGMGRGIESGATTVTVAFFTESETASR